MKEKTWRDDIDDFIKKKMECADFKLIDDNYHYVLKLSPQADMVVQIKQGNRDSQVQKTTIFVNMSVIHKELAELEGLLKMPTTMPLLKPYWFHSVSEYWLFSYNLSSSPPVLPWEIEWGHLKQHVRKVAAAVVESIVQRGVPLALRFQNLELITKELTAPKDTTPELWLKYAKLQTAYLLANRLDEAEAEFERFRQLFKNENPTKSALEFDRNFLLELARRKASKI